MFASSMEKSWHNYCGSRTQRSKWEKLSTVTKIIYISELEFWQVEKRKRKKNSFFRTIFHALGEEWGQFWKLFEEWLFSIFFFFREDALYTIYHKRQQRKTMIFYRIFHYSIFVKEKLMSYWLKDLHFFFFQSRIAKSRFLRAALRVLL